MKFKVGDKVVIVEEEGTFFEVGKTVTVVAADEGSYYPYDIQGDSDSVDCVKESIIQLVTEAEEEVTEEAAMFKVGDKVVIVDSELTIFNKGELLTITRISKGARWPYTLSRPDGQDDTVGESNIELVANEEDKEVTQIKKGDKAKILRDPDHGGPFSVGQVVTVGTLSDDRINLVDSLQSWWFSVDDVELVQDSPEDKEELEGFKVGDVVTILNSTFTLFDDGDTGTIVEIDSDAEFPYMVRNDTDGNSFNDREIELYVKDSVQEVTEEEPKFKTGDTVIIKNQEALSGSPLSKTDVLSVDVIDGNCVRVKDERSSGWWFCDHDLELVPESVPEVPGMFKEGDKVRIIGDSHGHDADIGVEATIMYVDPDDGTLPYRVQPDGEDYKTWVTHSDIEAASVAPVAPVVPAVPGPLTIKDVIENGDAVLMECGRIAVYLSEAQGQKDVLIYTSGFRGWDKLGSVQGSIAFVERSHYDKGLQADPTGVKSSNNHIVWPLQAVEPAKKMTLVDIEKELGYPVEIINEEGE